MKTPSSLDNGRSGCPRNDDRLVGRPVASPPDSEIRPENAPLVPVDDSFLAALRGPQAEYNAWLSRMAAAIEFGVTRAPRRRRWTLPLLLRWRWWCWGYRSAAGGWYLVLLGYGFHVVPCGPIPTERGR